MNLSSPRKRYHYDISINNSTISPHLNNSSQPVCINDFELRRMETISKLCLSCHDGVVAVSSFGTNIGSQYISGDSLIGTSLQDDHPISIYWSHQVKFTSGSGTCINCHNPRPTDFNPILPFFDRYLECATCHDVHNTAGNDHLLRLPLINSQLCLHCHGK